MRNQDCSACCRFSEALQDLRDSLEQAKQPEMDSAKRCQDQLAECRRLMPLAKSQAESTVLKNLIRSWKMIGNQLALYEEIIGSKK
jgi:hypothetical protein